ncbi:MAG: histidine phosphatase family protein [Pseudomonas sp.]
MSAPGRLIFVRHGQTPANVERVWHGSTDTPLTELGHAQARKLSGYFHNVMKPDVVFASPLQRARNTAEALASRHDLEVNLDPRLQELCLGDWEGLHFDDINSGHDKEGRLYSDPDFAPPGGESQRMVRDRMVAVIEEVLNAHRGRNIVVVSHGVAIGVTLSHFLHSDTTRWLQYNHQNTAFSELCPREKKLIYFNRTDHYDWV